MNTCNVENCGVNDTYRQSLLGFGTSTEKELPSSTSSKMLKPTGLLIKQYKHTLLYL